MSSLVIHYHGSDLHESSALELVDSQNIQLTNIKFEKMDAALPSRAVYVYNSTAQISDCSFFNGYANFVGNSAASAGGGIVKCYFASQHCISK